MHQAINKQGPLAYADCIALVALVKKTRKRARGTVTPVTVDQCTNTLSMHTAVYQSAVHSDVRSSRSYHVLTAAMIACTTCTCYIYMPIPMELTTHHMCRVLLGKHMYGYTLHTWACLCKRHVSIRSCPCMVYMRRDESSQSPTLQWSKSLCDSDTRTNVLNSCYCNTIT